MADLISALREMVRRTQLAAGETSAIIESEAILEPPSFGSREVATDRVDNSDPLNRERIVEERLSELSTDLGVRYRQVCRDLRDPSRISWTSDAHELRDILAHVLRALAPDEDVEAERWYKPVERTKGPTHAQRAKYILLQNRSQDDVKDDARDAATEIEHIEELASKIARATYMTGSKLAHNSATRRDCISLLFHFDALMFSLLNASTDGNRL